MVVLIRSLVSLRAKCFLIAYLNLVACLVDTVFHVLIAGIVSNGFQCDIDANSLRAVSWPWLERLLIFVNLGTHGFYPLPMILKNNAQCIQIPREPQCYPGMIHVYLIDVLNYIINIIWLKFIISYIYALHKKDLEPMRLFFILSAVKLGLQLLYFVYRPVHITSLSWRSYWFLCMLDLCLAIYFLLTINKYINFVKAELAVENSGGPPPYVECLMYLKKAQSDADVPGIKAEEATQDVIVNMKNEAKESESSTDDGTEKNDVKDF